jgi:choice-of-anchor B domain-containing protein
MVYIGLIGLFKRKTRVIKYLSIKYFLLASSLLLATQAWTHSEPSKSRYVSEHGEDKGFCDNPIRPCKTISYAVSKANKGDNVLVASGQYSISSAEELFYLKSELVPVLAGYNRFDHFQSQSPNVNKSFLTGVPPEMVPDLRRNGFHVIADGKASQLSASVAAKMKEVESLKQKQTAVDCVNGRAGNFRCNNIDLLAHVPLNAFSSFPSSGNDIWGHVDLNNNNEYAIMGVQNGVAVFDVTDPENPVEVGTVSGSSASWRDIKVYQYFDDSLNSWRAFAYATVDGRSDGVSIIDLNDLPNSISLVERNNSVGNAHNVYISNVDYSLNIVEENTQAKLQLVGSSNFQGSFHSYSLDNPATINVENGQSSFQGYTHDGASVTIDDSRKDSGCVNSNGVNCTVFVDFNEKQMYLWDITNPADTQQLGMAEYNDVPSSAKYVHSGWVTEDKRYILLHDEFDESRANINTTVRIFQINDLRNPVQVGQWTGPTGAIDHNGFVRGNRYYMSTYERGLTVLDITDPTSPIEVGYFDTFPSNNNPSYNGAWGAYPFLPSGNILVSDINSGLYILKDNTKQHNEGQLQFKKAQLTLDRGQTVDINVQRTDTGSNPGATSVKFDFLSGSASSGSDFSLNKGILEWAAGDTSDKQISINISDFPPNSQPTESFFLRLTDPKNGATIGDNGYLTITLNGEPQSGAVQFTTANADIAEENNSITITVERLGGSKGVATVDYVLSGVTATAAEDYVDTSGTLQWQDGDRDDKSFEITINADTNEEGDESFNVILQSATGASLGNTSEMQVTILDDDTNTAPSVSIQEDFEVNTGQTVELTASATDAENHTVTFGWEQTAGESVELSNATSATASFIAPDNAGELSFQVTASDVLGAQATASVTVTVVAPSDNGDNGDNGGNEDGGSSGGLLFWTSLMLVFFSRLRKRG